MTRAPSWYQPAWPGLKNRPRTSGSPRKRRASPEHDLQRALVVAIRRAAPNVIFYAAANGGHRHLLTAVRMKAEGVMPGVPDLHFLLDGGRIAYLELKAAKGRLSPDQAAFRDRAVASGALWAMAKDFDAAWSVLAEWNVVPVDRSRA